jgi:hypothetical protein
VSPRLAQAAEAGEAGKMDMRVIVHDLIVQNLCISFLFA